MKPDVIAFYLPQYYPTPENDEWFGKGFTEWRSVGNSKPLFKNHYQPKVPADLGYYDLRLPEVRKAQADLAKEAGIAAFCYYHYWFGDGKEMLQMPLNEVVRLGEPDFPFCICWANHSWYKKTWDSSKSLLNHQPLIEQKYLGKDDIEKHFYSLLPAFSDKRYYKHNGKLLFVLYRVLEIPYLEQFMETWQELALKNGLPEFYFVSYADDFYELQNSNHTKCDATALFLKSEIESAGKSVKIRKISRFLKTYISQKTKRPLNVFEYKNIYHKLVSPKFSDERILPVIMPNWDNTPRRETGALILNNCTPKLFKKHVKEVLNLIKNKKEENRIVFIKSWNEWSEGNYMEPDLKYGKGYINALKEALEEDLL